MSQGSVAEHLHKAYEIASPAEIESIEGYDENLDLYRENDYSFVPMPFDDCFYNLDIDEMREISEAQRFHFESTLSDILPALSEYPFIILSPSYSGCKLLDSKRYVIVEDNWHRLDVEDGPNYLKKVHYPSPRYNAEGIDEVVRANPGLKAEFVEIYRHDFQIVTRADLNRRSTRVYFYELLAEFEMRISDLLKSELDSEDIYGYVSDRRMSRYIDDKERNQNLHLAEYMSTRELINALSHHPSLQGHNQEAFRNEIGGRVEGIAKLRNQVMHPNRKLALEDITSLIGRLSHIRDGLELLGIKHVAVGEE